MLFRIIVIFILLYYSRIQIRGSNTEPSTSWKELPDHTDTLSRIYFDDHLAIYTDNPSVVGSSSVSWLSPRLSLSWKYVKDIYGSFGTDPHLYVILQTNANHRGYCRSYTFESTTFHNRNTIDCGLHSNSSWTWGTNNTANYEWVFINIAKIIQNKAPHGTIQNADKKVCGDKMEDIIVYDIYRNFRGQNDSRHGPRPDLDTDPDVIWRRRKSEEELTTATADGIHWFRDWFFPIYESYGESPVLNRYYAKVKEVWPIRNKRYWCRMTTLDFIYFWSEATGDDLVPSATVLFSWNATLNENSQIPNERLSSAFNVKGNPSTLLGWNGKPLNWYKEWFLPIYESYGGVSILKKYIEIVKKHASRVTGKKLSYLCDMNIGDFVHFWSEAAGVDLAPVARNLFQDSNFESFLTNAKKVSLNYAASQPIPTRNLSAHRPPAKWLYDENGENQELKLIYWDKELSIYYTNPPTVMLKSTSSYKIISLAWAYAKKTYGPFGPEKLLYIALQDNRDRQCKSSNDAFYYDSYSHDRHFIQCSLPLDQQSSELLAELVISQIGLLAIKLNNETGNWPAKKVSGWSIASILVYDIYMGIGRVEDASRWNTENMKDKPIKHLFGSDDSSGTRFEMYRNWYKIIYDKYGKTGVLKRFLSILNDHWPKRSIPEGKGQDYTGQLNVGEFVHFWSGASGENLFDLAGNVTHFNWGEATVVQVLNATKFYPNIAHSSSKTPRRMISQSPKKLNFVVQEKSLGSWQWLRSVYRDPNLVIYIDKNILLPLHESFPPLSTSPWAYLKTSYWFPLQAHEKSITILVRNRMRGAEGEDTNGGCKHYENNDAMQILTSDGKGNLRNVFDCQPLAGLKDRNESLDFLWSIMAKEIVKQVEVITEDSSEDDYAVQTMSAIHNTINFDLYLGVGTFREARRFLQRIMKTKDDKIFGKKRWFSDWFFPIYVNNGGFSMLNQFTLISDDRRTAIENGNWSTTSTKMNVGDFVHMWSAASGANLENLAKNTFVWDKDSPAELEMARENLPGDNNEHLAYLSNADEPPPVKVKASSTNEKPEDWSKLYIVAGGAASVLVIFFIAVCIKFAMYRRKIQILSQQIRNLTPSEMDEFYQGNPNLSNDDPHVPIHQLPFDRSYEVDTERLIISTSRVLGTGEFGLVRYGTLKGVAEGKSEYGNMAEADDVEVAVKTVKPNVAVSYFKALLSEIKIMAYLGRHENITSLLATVTANIKQCEVFVALEFCAKGDLLHHLKNHGHNFEDLLHENKNDIVDGDSKCVYVNKPNSRVTFEGNPKKRKNAKSSAPTYENTVTISTLDLIEWSRQISSGMEYLCVKDVIHGDLAARNVLLTAENVAKISDFGLSRQLVNYDNYKKKSSTPVPWKWLAIESLNSMTFSSFSDVWAFGVTMWEIFTLGKVPYPGKSWNNEFVDELTAGIRLSLPEYANPEIYTVMLDCMKKVPAQRITFLQAIDKLNEIKLSLAVKTAERKNSEMDFASTSRGHASYMAFNE